jgi:hypothetical protein
MAEWWPSSAKLAVNRDYARAHHAPHWADVMGVLQKILVVPTPTLPNRGPSQVDLFVENRKETPSPSVAEAMEGRPPAVLNR